MLTCQRIQQGTKEFKSFVRKLSKASDGWQIKARFGTEPAMLCFHKTFSKAGEPDEDVEIRTDIEVENWVKPGLQGDSVSSGSKVYVEVMTVKAVRLSHSDVCAVCSLILDGHTRFFVDGGRGSYNSTVLGLTFYQFGVVMNGFGHVHIGGVTVAKDGRQICSSAVDLRS